MTDLCSGGPSAKKAGTDDLVMLFAEILASVHPSFAWIIPYLRYIEPVAVITDDYCGTDPPDVPVIDGLDLLGLITGGRGGAGIAALGKFAALVRHFAWYELCECTSVSTPAPPAPQSPPASLPEVAPTGPGGSIRVNMLRAQCRIFNQWNGTTNIALPTGWTSPSFDDSSWASPGAELGSAGTGVAIINPSGATISPTLDAGGAEQVGLVSTSSDRERFGIRWTFDLPPVALADTIVLYSHPGGLSSGNTWVNGFAGIILNALNWTSSVARLRPGDRNVIAFEINSSNTSNAITWSGEAWYALALEFPGTVPGGGVDCCARLETLLIQLAARINVLAADVTLVQRQGVPFGYVPGPEHAALSGAGEVAIDPSLAVTVELTTLPASYGMAEGSPDRLFEIGWIARGTADGFEDPRPITTSPFMLRVSGDITRIGYAFNVGIVATIREHAREP